MRLLSRLVCRLLIASMVLLPFSTQAGMIGTDRAIASAQDQANRDRVRDFMSRGDVVKQFEALGLSTTTAQARVDAMTQDEINRIAGKLDSAPAGGMSSWAIGGIVIAIAVLIWYFYGR